MKVTNEDIEAIRTVLGILNTRILQNQNQTIVKTSIKERDIVHNLKNKLIREFSEHEFPEMKEPH